VKHLAQFWVGTTLKSGSVFGRRQHIIVTHNPNVAVLGDAEQIVVMKAHNDRGEIVTRGSIDSPETRDAACAILEGAMEAFTRRAKMYGVTLS
jgi:hypothetical protein